MTNAWDVLQNSASAQQSDRTIEPVIGLALSQSNSQAAFVYRFDDEAGMTLAASVGPTNRQPDRGSPRVNLETVALHRARTSPIVLRDGAWSDRRFAALPEFHSHRFEGVISIPLMSATAVVGVANYCRTESCPIVPSELALLLELNQPLAALLTASTLREELERTLQRLAERKILDRAKGLLQANRGWTEEQAYMHIRLVSRQSRVPMRNVAERLIQSSRQQLEASA